MKNKEWLKQSHVKYAAIPIVISLAIAASIQCSAFRSSSITPGKYRLEYRMPAGTKMTLATLSKNRNQQEIMGNKVVTDIHDRMELGLKVGSTSKNGNLMEMEYRERSHQAEHPQGKMSTDFSRLIGQKVHFLLSPKGSLSDFEGFEHLPEIEMTDRQMTLNEEFYIWEISQILPEFPEKPIAPGESWSYVKELTEPTANGEVKVTIHFNYTLLEECQKDGFDCLKFAGKLSFEVEGTESSGGLDFLFKMQGSGDEIVYFAHKKGMILSIETDSFLTGSASNADTEMTIPMNFEYETDINVQFL